MSERIHNCIEDRLQSPHNDHNHPHHRVHKHWFHFYNILVNILSNKYYFHRLNIQDDLNMDHNYCPPDNNLEHKNHKQLLKLCIPNILAHIVCKYHWFLDNILISRINNYLWYYKKHNQPMSKQNMQSLKRHNILKHTQHTKLQMLNFKYSIHNDQYCKQYRSFHSKPCHPGMISSYFELSKFSSWLHMADMYCSFRYNIQTHNLCRKS